MNPVLLRIRGGCDFGSRASTDLWIMARLWIMDGRDLEQRSFEGLRSFRTGKVSKSLCRSGFFSSCTSRCSASMSMVCQIAADEVCGGRAKY